jgi:hypothetical protein
MIMAMIAASGEGERDCRGHGRVSLQTPRQHGGSMEGGGCGDKARTRVYRAVAIRWAAAECQ